MTTKNRDQERAVAALRRAVFAGEDDAAAVARAVTTGIPVEAIVRLREEMRVEAEAKRTEALVAAAVQATEADRAARLARDEAIRAAVRGGVSLRRIARETGMSPQRAHQLAHGANAPAEPEAETA